VRILAIDTALGACSACVADGEAAEILAEETIVMQRGHAEALVPLLDRIVARVENGFHGLDRIAVTVGPGSYTGLRVGIAAARAIGLAAHLPVVGVTTLSALLASLVTDDNRRLLAAAVDARRGQVYFQAIAPGGRTIIAPSLLGVSDACRLIGAAPATLIGSGAPAVAAEAPGFDIKVFDTPPAPSILWIARLGAVADPAQALPRPLYLRGPGAQPQDAARLARMTATA
jgi:tRNA threonylcarbamoyladenosine biosynthesis protein TsaB